MMGLATLESKHVLEGFNFPMSSQRTEGKSEKT